MKKILLVLLFLTASFSVFSQVKFEKGYIIDNNGTRTECLIENKDWVYNPESIRYKLTENASPQEGNLATLKEFGVYNYSRYIRAVVQMDHSKSYPINALSNAWSPEWETDTLFLKTIVLGKASLYSYEILQLKKFFYTSKADSSIKQLVYKQYRLSEADVLSNNTFRQQLLNEVNCGNLAKHYFENLPYEPSILRRHFEKYNYCAGDKSDSFENAVTVKGENMREFLNLRFTPGVSYTSLSIDYAAGSLIRDVTFDNQLFFRLGVEVEYILAFHKNKWGLFVEPSYQYFTGDKLYTSLGTTYRYVVDYKSIEIPFGVRHYFFLSDKSKLFLNVAVISAPIKYLGDSRVSYGTTSTEGSRLDIKAKSVMAVGGGFSFGNFGLEARYCFGQNILADYKYNTTNYTRISFVAGYRFLNLKTKPTR